MHIYFRTVTCEEIVEDLFILAGNLDNILLGHTFLTKNEAQLDYRNRRIRLNVRFLFASSEDKLWSTSPDFDIMQKVYLGSSSEQIAIQKLIQEYSQSNPILGTIPNQKFEKELNDSSPPRKLPYPIPFKLIDATKNEIERLHKLGIIQRSSSEYACAVFPILKRNGEIRLGFDYRPLNPKISTSLSKSIGRVEGNST